MRANHLNRPTAAGSRQTMLSGAFCMTSRYLMRATSIVMLTVLPAALLWPYWRHTLPERLAQPLMSAIYEFTSDDMPRCEQFVRQTTADSERGSEAGSVVGPVACETNPAQMMV